MGKLIDSSMTINLQAPLFNGKEEEWLEFAEVMQTNFKSKQAFMEDDGCQYCSGKGKEIRKDEKCNGGSIHDLMFECYSNAECHF